MIFNAIQVAIDYIFFFQAEDGIRDFHVTGVQTCALPISSLTRPSFKSSITIFLIKFEAADFVSLVVLSILINLSHNEYLSSYHTQIFMKLQDRKSVV